MVPIIYRLKKDYPEILIECIIVDLENTFSRDYRIKYLIDNDIKVNHIINFINFSNTFQYCFKTLTDLKTKNNSFILIKVIIKILLKAIRNIINSRIQKFPVDKIVDKLLKRTKGVFVFDQSFNPFYEKICKYLKNRDISSIAVPHGHNIISNQMISTELLNIEYKKGRQDHSVFFDYVIFANRQTSQKWHDFGYLKEDQIRIFGSSRYCDEWIKKNHQILPKNELPILPEKTFKVVIMLTKPLYNIFVDEVNRNIKYVSAFPNVYVVVKPHTRGESLKNIKFRDNVKVVDNSFHSPNLIEWSDVVFFTASSIVFESLKMDKPTVYMKNTHSNKLLFESLFKSWGIECRDDLRDLMWHFIKNKSYKVYSKQEKKEYLQTLIEPKGPDVLLYYTQFLVKLLE